MPVTIFRGNTASELHVSSSRVAPVEDDIDAGAVAVSLGNDAAVERRLRALEEREAAVLRREAAVLQRETDARQRETDAREREKSASLREVDARRVGAAAAPKAEETEDPLSNAVKIVDAYQNSGGEVPLGVHVLEVTALQQAVTLLRNNGDRFHHQLKELKQREETVLRDWKGTFRETDLRKAQKSLDKAMGESREQERALVEQFNEMRDAGVERFVPLLLHTVEKFDARYERAANAPGGEAALRGIEALVKPFRRSKPEIHQQPPCAEEVNSQSTLMRLLTRAVAAAPELRRLADDCVRAVRASLPDAHIEVVPSPQPVKSIRRCLQKTQCDYGGDYTRISDYVRCTILCDRLVEVRDALAWLLEACADRFEVIRVKDRITRSWDPELSGGNRDVMVNGRLALGRDHDFVVEIQLHVRSLFELKGDLHVLYEGARILGAMEATTTTHDGVLSDDALARARRGIIRKLVVKHTIVSEDQRRDVAKLLTTEPCALLECNLYRATDATGAEPAFRGWSLAALALPDPKLGPTAPACRRLRVLDLCGLGLTGNVPPGIGELRSLEWLNLQENELAGALPAALGTLPRLKRFSVHTNQLSGELPDFSRAVNLEKFSAHTNRFVGAIPEHWSRTLRDFKVHRNALTGPCPDFGACTKLKAVWAFQNALDPETPATLMKLASCDVLIRDPVEAERAAVDAQAGGGPVFRRLRGEPGISIRADAARPDRRRFFLGSVLGADGAVATSGVAYYEVALHTDDPESFEVGFAGPAFERSDAEVVTSLHDDPHAWAAKPSAKQGDTVRLAALLDAGIVGYAVNDGPWRLVARSGAIARDGAFPLFAASGGAVLGFRAAAPFAHATPDAAVVDALKLEVEKSDRAEEAIAHSRRIHDEQDARALMASGSARVVDINGQKVLM